MGKVSPARRVALSSLQRISTQSAFAHAALRAEIATQHLDGADVHLATELVYGVLRQQNQLDRAISLASGRRFKDIEPKIHDVLRLAAYQAIFLDRVPDHAIVHEAVEQAKQRRGEGAGRFCNAVLRKLLTLPPEKRLPVTQADFKTAPAQYLTEELNVNEALAEFLLEELGPETAHDFLSASALAAPSTLRANIRKNSRDDLLAELQATTGSSPVKGLSPVAIHLGKNLGCLPQDLAAVREGRATVQDEASMRVVELLAPEPGEKILDLCAAPGGKTTYIAEMMDDRGSVVAHDRLPKKLRHIEDHVSRLDLHIIQTTELLPEPDERFDRVLVDAPCSGLGTLRRHPEIRWRFNREQLADLNRLQKQLLATGFRYVRPGGVLVYSVCSVAAESEGQQIIAALQNKHENSAENSAGRDPLAGLAQLESVQTTGPHLHTHTDGFFMARFRRLP